MSDALKHRMTVRWLFGVLGLLLFSGVLWRFWFTQPRPKPESEGTKLLQYKTDYVGNNSKVVNLINHLALAEYPKTIVLETRRIPYGVVINYNLEWQQRPTATAEAVLYKNAVVLLALVGNLDQVTFWLREMNGKVKYQYSRAVVQRNFTRDLRAYAHDEQQFAELLRQLDI